MLKTGEIAPAFELPDPDDNPVSLAGLLAEGPVLLYFYPADFSPLCTKQACMVNAAIRQPRIVGISAQSPAMHRRFRRRHGLTFPLLSDPGRRVARAYGATAAFGLLPRRVSYDIAPDRRIVDAAESNLSLKAHRRFLDRALARRQ